jgi:uncharacterized protein YhaN
MRIRQLDLLKYGHFTNATIDLPTGKPDFQMLLGENEAGKSTTMGGVEDLFFGIPANSPREINDGQVSFDHTALSTLVCGSTVALSHR